MINREFLKSGGLTEALAAAGREGLLRLTTPEERRQSRERLLKAAPHAGGDVWVFAYGSLMWNPAFHHVETRLATVHGYHRRFCLETPVGRGSRDQPGLMLGLDRGGSCRGKVLRIAAPQVQEELDILWSREMVADGYRPIWVSARCADGSRVFAIAFAIETASRSYAGRLSPTVVAERIARATGALGSCRTYLEETVAHLRDCGIEDRGLNALLAQVQRIGGPGADPTDVRSAPR